MYTKQQSQTVRAMGNWLGGMPWDIFSTITYRHNSKAKQNFKRSLRNLLICFG